MGAVDHEVGGGPVRLASTCSIASASGCPLGSRPSVSTVKDITTGRPAADAARTMPIASSTYVIVRPVIRSASVSARTPACHEWNASASSAVMWLSGS